MLPKALPSSRCKRRAGNIMKHPTRPTHRLFYFHTKTTRLRNSYYPQEVSSTLASMMTQQQLTLYVVCSVLFSVHCCFLLLFYLFIFILKHVNHVKTDLSFVCFISFVFLIFFFFFNGCYIVWCVSNPHLVSRGHFRGETTNVDPVLALGAGGCGRWSVVQRRQLSWEYNNLCTVDQTHMTSICIIEQNHSHGRPSLCNTLVAYPLLGIRIAIALSNTVRVRFDNHFHFRIFKSWLKIRKLCLPIGGPITRRWKNCATARQCIANIANIVFVLTLLKYACLRGAPVLWCNLSYRSNRACVQAETVMVKLA